jgi:hypothetical protein
MQAEMMRLPHQTKRLPHHGLFRCILKLGNRFFDVGLFPAARVGMPASTFLLIACQPFIELLQKLQPLPLINIMT